MLYEPGFVRYMTRELQGGTKGWNRSECEKESGFIEKG